MITVDGYSPSGNCHEPHMLPGHLGRDHRWGETDSAHGRTRTAEDLAKNWNGRVPLIETDDGRILLESKPILFWLAERTTRGSAETTTDSPTSRCSGVRTGLMMAGSCSTRIRISRRGWTAFARNRRLLRCHRSPPRTLHSSFSRRVPRVAHARIVLGFELLF